MRVRQSAFIYHQYDMSEEETKQSTSQDSAPRSFMAQVGRFSQIAFVLPAATLVGWFIGMELDKKLHTDWIYIAGLFLGIVAGFVDLIRTVSADSK